MRVARLAAVAVGVFGLLVAGSPVMVTAGSQAAAPARPDSAAAGVIVRPGVIRAGQTRDTSAGPFTAADCEKAYQVACYGPAQIRQAYDLPALYAGGVTGRGATIVIVDSYGSPTIRNDLAVFDRAYQIPAPPQFQIIQPAGRVPAYDPANSNMVGWAGETTLDVEWAHAVAPGANILLVETPVSETEGVHGFPQIVMAEQYVLSHYHVDVISQSFSATEETFPSPASVQALRGAYQAAYQDHVTVLAASGDSGAADVGPDETTYYSFRVTSWPDSDPLVTGVGGTQLHFTAQGTPAAPTVWNDTYNRDANEFADGNPGPNPLASGGGTSIFFTRPSYQDGVADVVHGSRGVPDISMSAACSGSVNTYDSFGGAPALDPDLRHQRGDAAVRGHRGPGRPSGGSPPRADQPGPVPAGRPARARHRRRDLGQQHSVVHPERPPADGDRLQRRARLRPGHGRRHGGRPVLRPRTGRSRRPQILDTERSVVRAAAQIPRNAPGRTRHGTFGLKKHFPASGNLQRALS